MRRWLVRTVAVLILATATPAWAGWTVFFNDSFQRAGTSAGTVTGPASDSPLQTDPFSSPSTGAAYIPIGSAAAGAQINGSHQLVCLPGANTFTDGLIRPPGENLLNAGAEATVPAGLAGTYTFVRVRVSADGQNCYQVYSTSSSNLVIAKVVAGAFTPLNATSHTALTAYESVPVVYHIEATGSNPTVINAWLADPATPETPLSGTSITWTDSDAALQAAGSSGVSSSNLISNFRVANLAAAVAPTIGTLIPATGTTTSIQFAAPSITGTGSYTYAWATAPFSASPSWATVGGATTATPTLTISGPTLVQLSVTDTGAGNLTGTTLGLAWPWKSAVKVCEAGDSITGLGGLPRASADGTALNSVLPTVAASAAPTVYLQAQEIFGARPLTLLGMGVSGSRAIDWAPSAAPYGTDPANLYAQLKRVLTVNGFGSGDVVGIMLGMNDAGGSTQNQYQTAMQAIATQLKADFPGVLIVLHQPTAARPTSPYTNTYVKDGDLSDYGKILLPAVAAASGSTVSVGTRASYDLFANHPDRLQADGIHPQTSPTNYYPSLWTERFRNLANALDGLTGSGSGSGGYRRRPQYRRRTRCAA